MLLALLSCGADFNAVVGIVAIRERKKAIKIKDFCCCFLLLLLIKIFVFICFSLLSYSIPLIYSFNRVVAVAGVAALL